MTEDFLHYLWKYKLYKPGLYSTSEGESLEIIHPGLHNSDAGPDFFNAKIKIGDTLWAGNVEIHVKASEWHRHAHDTDKAYDNVVLHVVTVNDAPASTSTGRVIPVWEMQFDNAMIDRYIRLQQNGDMIPCSPFLKNISAFDMDSWLGRMMIEKLERKVEVVQKLLAACKNDWDEVFYVMLLRNFGFGLNGEPFEQLARQTPWRILLKNADDLLRLEAILLGQGGFLSELLPADEYVKTLQKEYQLLKQKYGLKPIPMHNWKFLRLRPTNFPTIRLVQLAWLFHMGNISLDKVTGITSLHELTDLLAVSPKGYWLTHYRPGAESPQKSKKMGDTSRSLIVINTLAPLLFAYGRLRGDEIYCDRAIEWLDAMKPESNSVIDRWNESDIKALNASQSQALVYLNHNYCKIRRCLHCRIGHQVISKL
jgi:hypothetical protein